MVVALSCFVADIYNVKVLQHGPLDLEFLVSVQCAQIKLSLAVYDPPSSPVGYFDTGNLYSILTHPLFIMLSWLEILM